MEITKELTQNYLLLRSLQISPKYRGCKYLAAAIRYASLDENVLSNVSRNLYPMLAEVYHTSPDCIEHNMRKAITISWECGGRAQYEHIAKCEVVNRPSVTDFIGTLANYMVRYGYREW